MSILEHPRPDTAALAARYGTPLYLYELDDVDAAADDLRRALPAPSTLYYSLKANPHPVLARALRGSGAHAEISSSGELASALAAGYAGADCLYTGPGKSAGEIAAALAAGVRLFSVESACDYRRVSEVAAAHDATAECLVRVNTPRIHGSAGLRMTGQASQFGMDSELLTAGAEQFGVRAGARVIGLHFFSQSNVTNPDDLVAEARANIEHAARLRDEAGIDLRMVDLGGGFAAPYARAGRRPDYRDVRARIEECLDSRLGGWRSGRIRIAFESGRYLVADCGRLIASVVDVKRSRDRMFAVLDSGINHLGGLAGLGRLLPIAASVVRVDGPQPTQVPDRDGSLTLVGPLCTPADLLARESTTGPLSAGDLVEVPNVGAYGLTASLIGFLSRPAATEVVLRGGDPVDASRLHLHRAALTAQPESELVPRHQANGNRTERG